MSTERPLALVTGASGGIGRASASALVKAGFTVVGTSRSAVRATPLDGVVFLDLDVTSDGSVETLVQEVIERFGRIDVLVNNAGIGAAAAAEESSTDQVKDVFEVNVFGAIRMTQAVLPHMRSQGRGRIINVSSILGLIRAPFMAVYAASKHSIEGFSESVDHEVREHGVRVLLVEPGYTRSQFEANSIAPDRPLATYAAQRQVAGRVLSAAMRDADDPGVVADVVVKAATSKSPKLRYAAGKLAGRVRILRRFVPSAAFDKQIRKLNQLPAGALR